MLSMWKQIGTVDVDSGQIMITDPCYLSDYKDNDFMDLERGPETVKDDAFSYDDACVLTSKPPYYGSLFRGGVVVTSTECGDGSYPVFVRLNGSSVAMVAVRFDLADGDSWSDPY